MSNQYWKRWSKAWVAVAVFAVINIAYQLYLVTQKTELLTSANLGYVGAAVAIETLAYLVLVPGFRRFYRSSGITMSFSRGFAGMFAGLGLAKVVPFGDYLLWRRLWGNTKTSHRTAAQFAAVFYTLALGILIGLFLLAQGLTLIFSPSQAAEDLAGKFLYLPLVLGGAIILGLFFSRRQFIRRPISKVIRRELGEESLSPIKTLRGLKYRQRDYVVLIAGFTLTWILEAGTLLLCLQAFGQSPPILIALLGYTFARLFILLPIIPGGVGEVEAATTLFFVAYGYDPLSVLTATVVFRVLTYWLPIVVGGLSYLIIKKPH